MSFKIDKINVGVLVGTKVSLVNGSTSSNEASKLMHRIRDGSLGGNGECGGSSRWIADERYDESDTSNAQKVNKKLSHHYRF